MKTTLLFLLACTAFSASADCWVVTNFNGEFTSGRNEWKFERLSKPNYTLHIAIDGKKASITAGQGTQQGEPRALTILNPTALNSFRSNDGVTETENFAIQNDKVFYSSVIQNVRGTEEAGVIVMVGDVAGKCQG